MVRFLLQFVLVAIAAEAFNADSLSTDWTDLPLPPDCTDATKVVTDFAQRCNRWNAALTVKKPDGSVVAKVEGMGRKHYHPFEIHGTQLFWVRRSEKTTFGADGRPNNYVELHVMDMLSKQQETLGSARDFDYRANQDGRYLMMLRTGELTFYDRSTNQTTVLHEAPSDEQHQTVEMRGWEEHQDPKKGLVSIYRFAVGLGDSCQKVGTYTVGAKTPLTWEPCFE